ncbi:hypothetical protein RI367_001780 [Sorochytrium milnesiophthora]
MISSPATLATLCILLLAASARGAIHHKDLTAHLAKFEYVKLSKPVHQHFADRHRAIDPLTVHAFGNSYKLHLALNDEFFAFAHPSQFPSVDRSTFIRGHVDGHEDASAVRLTLVDGAMEGVISLHKDGEHHLLHIQPVVGKPSQDSGEADASSVQDQPMVIYRQQDERSRTPAGKTTSCDTSLLPTSSADNVKASLSAQQSPLQKRQYSGMRVCTIGVVIDKSFTDEFGQAKGEQMALQAFSLVDALYEQTFRVRTPVRALDSITDVNHPSQLNQPAQPADLLATFTEAMAQERFSFRPNEVCATHLITHRDITNLLGRAYIASEQPGVAGGMCASYGNTGFSTSLALDIVRSVPAIAQTIAHELGHTFGALHEEDTPCSGKGLSIMDSKSDPTVGIQTQHFSSCALQSVSSILNSSKSDCLIPVGSRIHRARRA